MSTLAEFRYISLVTCCLLNRQSDMTHIIMCIQTCVLPVKSQSLTLFHAFLENLKHSFNTIQTSPFLYTHPASNLLHAALIKLRNFLSSHLSRVTDTCLDLVPFFYFKNFSISSLSLSLLGLSISL